MNPVRISFLGDYAYFQSGLIDLYEADHDREWLNWAMKLDRLLEDFYEDKNNGGFFTTPSDHDLMIAREKPDHDGALPSPNSIAIMNLLRLYACTHTPGLLMRAEKALSCFSTAIEKSPHAFGEMLLAVEYMDSLKSGKA